MRIGLRKGFLGHRLAQVSPRPRVSVAKLCNIDVDGVITISLAAFDRTLPDVEQDEADWAASWLRVRRTTVWT
jgi:hypothetical protein